MSSEMIAVPREFYDAAITLSGAEYRLRDWYVASSDEDEGQVEHLRSLAYSASETIRKYHISQISRKEG
jgi:hypothetical protein